MVYSRLPRLENCENSSVRYHIFPKTEYARPLFDASTDAALITWGGHSGLSILEALTTSFESRHH